MSEEKLTSYFFIYSAEVGSRNSIVNMLNDIDEIKDWRSEFENCFYLKSHVSPLELTKKIRALTARDGRFIIVEVNTNIDGYIHKDSWSFLFSHKKLNKMVNVD